MLRYHLFIAWKSLRRTPESGLLTAMGLFLGAGLAVGLNIVLTPGSP